MNWLFQIWSREPLVILELIKAGFVLAAAFGLHLTPEQLAALYGFITVVGTLVQRTQVTPYPPVSKP